MNSAEFLVNVFRVWLVGLTSKQASQTSSISCLSYNNYLYRIKTDPPIFPVYPIICIRSRLILLYFLFILVINIYNYCLYKIKTDPPIFPMNRIRRSGAPNASFLLKAQKYVLAYPEYFYTSRNAF